MFAEISRAEPGSQSLWSRIAFCLLVEGLAQWSLIKASTQCYQLEVSSPNSKMTWHRGRQEFTLPMPWDSMSDSNFSLEIGEPHKNNA